MGIVIKTHGEFLIRMDGKDLCIHCLISICYFSYPFEYYFHIAPDTVLFVTFKWYIKQGLEVSETWIILEIRNWD